ncbi:MAG TPA: hypothetical protein V6C63_12915 [Allocoleopsis sp.]
MNITPEYGRSHHCLSGSLQQYANRLSGWITKINAYFSPDAPLFTVQ